MKAIIPTLSQTGKESLYMQLYNYIKTGIVEGSYVTGEKLPSIRSLASSLRISVTTVGLAYQQLQVEGYIESVPQSGYFINDINPPSQLKKRIGENDKHGMGVVDFYDFSRSVSERTSGLIYDGACFDFVKWKKCTNHILNEYSQLLFEEGDPQGEYPLRYQISKYLYSNRGVLVSPDQIVIGAGMLQLMTQLSALFRFSSVENVICERPGYTPVRNIFNEQGFEITDVNVEEQGIKIGDLPAQKKNAVYVAPSNQFPTGAVMPIGKRYELLEWAEQNESFILEDDYDSELRYFGKPIPPLKSLNDDRVVYLSSFSSTLYPAIKISFMVLPESLAEIFTERKEHYTQTCSKTEQLTLAYYMSKGFYQANIKKLKNLYSNKLKVTIDAFEKYSKGRVNMLHSSSGVNMLLEVYSDESDDVLVEAATSLGLSVDAVDDRVGTGGHLMIFHFNIVPLDLIEEKVKSVISLWS